MTDKEQTKPKKAGRPVGSKDSKKRPEQTEAQKANRFKPGEVNNAEAWSMRKETRAFRKKCATILLSDEGTNAMLTMWTLCANQGRFREFMEIQRFLAEYAFGRPKEMLETEEVVNQLTAGTEHTPPIFGFVKGTIEEADASDEDYV